MTKTLVERLDAELQEIGGCHDRDCKVFVTPGMHTNGGCRCLRDAYTGQRVFRAYRRAVDDQDVEITRLASRIEELERALGKIKARRPLEDGDPWNDGYNCALEGTAEIIDQALSGSTVDDT